MSFSRWKYLHGFLYIKSTTLLKANKSNHFKAMRRTRQIKTEAWLKQIKPVLTRKLIWRNWWQRSRLTIELLPRGQRKSSVALFFKEQCFFCLRHTIIPFADSKANTNPKNKHTKKPKQTTKTRPWTITDFYNNQFKWRWWGQHSAYVKIDWQKIYFFISPIFDRQDQSYS